MSKHAKHRAHRASRLASALPRAAGAAAVFAAGSAALGAAPAQAAIIPDAHSTVLDSAVTGQDRDGAAARQAIEVADLKARLAVPARPHLHVTRPGESLSEIAQANCGTAADWIGLWHATRGIPNPNVIDVGQVIRLACTSKGAPYIPPAPPAPPVVTAAATQPQYQQPVQAASVGSSAGTSNSGGGSYGSVSPSGYSGMEACIVSRESGGQSQVMNSTGHYGLFQFSYSTWTGSGGSAADFGHASVAEQQQVFNNAVAARGYSDWAPYDGC